jgi:hypothetical protein
MYIKLVISNSLEKEGKCGLLGSSDGNAYAFFIISLQ